MKRLVKKTLTGGWIMPPVDFLLFALSLKIALVVLRRQGIAFWPHLADFSPLFVGWMCALHALGLYERRPVNTTVSLVRDLLFSFPVCLALGAGYFYLTSPYLGQTPKTILLVTVGLSHAGLFFWRRLALIANHAKPLNWSFFFLGSAEKACALRRHLHEACREADANFDPEYWDWTTVDLVVVDQSWAAAHWRKAKVVFLTAAARGVPIVSFESFYEARFGKISPHEAGHPSWALEFVLPRSGGFYGKVKRAFDVVGALTLLAGLSPLIALAWLAVVGEDGAPGFYGQRRVGYLGKSFVVWKLRTMRNIPEADKPFGSAHEAADPRITAVGRFLRRFRLDELPQLWNVLKGEMSLVGPRPEWIKETAVLEKLVQNYHLRHLVKPGITGWAQVYFRATNNPDDSFEKLCYDLYYVKHFSPAVDVSILLKTVKRVCVPDFMMADAAPRLVAPTATAPYDWTIETPASSSR